MELKGNQEAFDAMVAHMRAQKYVRSYTEGLDGVSTCAYRGPNGAKCVVGALIKDEHYFKGLEGLVTYDSNINTTLYLSGWDVDKSLLASMQDAHDDPVLWGVPDMDADGSRFEDAARRVAEDYGLSYTPPA